MPAPIPSENALCLVVEPKRAALYAQIESRVDEMIEAGALNEVEALLTLKLDPDLPVMKAIGVNSLSDFLNKRIDLEEAISRAKLETRRYAKRQMTWLRNRMADWQRLECARRSLPQYS